MKKAAIALVILLVVGGAAVAVVARRVLTGDNVRATIAAQVAAAIGQPVTIGGIGASIYPRVTVDLTEVGIGQPARVQFRSMHLVTGLRGLFSRRIEGATVHVNGARLTMPLPEFGLFRRSSAPEDRAEAGLSRRSSPADTRADLSRQSSPPNTRAGADLPVEIVSVDEIVLRDVEVVRGDRTLRGDIEIVPQGTRVMLRRVRLAADDTVVEATGTITSLSPVEGRIEAKADGVNFDRLVGFLSDFAATSSSTGAASAASQGSVEGRLTVDLTIGRATTGSLALSDFTTTAQVTPAAVAFEPLSFAVFGGRYDGAMDLTVGDAPRFRWRGKVAGISMPTLMAFAGAANSISGTLGGTVALEGSGFDMERAFRTARGTARISITDGAIAGLSLVRTLVLATSGRGGYVTSAQSALESKGSAGDAERFSRLGATLAMAHGVITTNDFAMTSTDVDLVGAGTVSMASLTAKLVGQARLSEALSKQGGTDLYRYTQEEGRVTLPATVSGPLGNLSVRIDLGDAMTRAVRNRAAEEARKAIERNLPGGLKGLFPRRPPRR